MSPEDVHHNSGDQCTISPQVFGTRGYRRRGPTLQVKGTVTALLGIGRSDNGDLHQRFEAKVVEVQCLGHDAKQYGQPEIGEELFVSVHIGDDDGIESELGIPNLAKGEPIEMQGEYISKHSPKWKQSSSNRRGLAVLHFTHHPLGSVLYDSDHKDGPELYQ